MKKMIVLVLSLALLLSIAASASAATINFNYTVPCQVIADDQLYRYHADKYIVELNNDRTIDVAHEVPGAVTIETNRVAIYRKNTGLTIGAAWKYADGEFYAYTSSVIVKDEQYTIAARGNTNYAAQFGNSITLHVTLRD